MGLGECVGKGFGKIFKKELAPAGSGRYITTINTALRPVENGTEADMTYTTEFPDFELGVAIPVDWKDRSWGNDTCPCWEAGTTPDGKAVLVYIDYADPVDREFEDTPRFTVRRDGEGCDLLDDDALTDDWSTVLITVARLTGTVFYKDGVKHVRFVNGSTVIWGTVQTVKESLRAARDSRTGGPESMKSFARLYARHARNCDLAALKFARRVAGDS